ncbi:unnamed protein product [Heligmosomoides polygyrus]|uniref:Transmembrane protein n=1 Tax=Heligmosomoides polygyrus TaxID=6339 RepID=A0A3P8B4D0_HELPZ|nr:unnamed protein product [Heligmosomoides polygyrus]
MRRCQRCELPCNDEIRKLVSIMVDYIRDFPSIGSAVDIMDYRVRIALFAITVVCSVQGNAAPPADDVAAGEGIAKEDTEPVKGKDKEENQLGAMVEDAKGNAPAPTTVNKFPTAIDLEQAEDSHFMTFIVVGGLLVFCLYLLHHNKKKILGLVFEGRAAGTSRRKVRYRRLSQRDDHEALKDNNGKEESNSSVRKEAGPSLAFYHRHRKSKAAISSPTGSENEELVQRNVDNALKDLEHHDQRRSAMLMMVHKSGWCINLLRSIHKKGE